MKLKHRIKLVLFYALRVFPIQKNKIVFSNFGGKGFGGDCKYIYEALKTENKQHDLDVVWLCDESIDTSLIPSDIRCVKKDSFKSMYELVTAQAWVDNIRKSGFVRKRKKQYYVMTWHGGIGVKKVEKDAEKALRRSYIYDAKNDSSMADLMMADSKWQYDLIRRAFWYNGEIAQCGLPRMDHLFNSDVSLKNAIKDKLGIPHNEKCVLYAPTFRAQLDSMDLSVYSLDWNAIIEALKQKTNDSWTGLMRLHPNIAELASSLNLPKSVVDVTAYPDMQELLLAADCLITDYSSAVFEFSIQKKMAFIFALDLKSYIRDRDLYFNYSELPFALAESNEELVKNINAFSQESYDKKIEEFFYSRCGLYNGGKASSFVAKQIMKSINC